MTERRNALVVDNGSWTVKAGFTGEDFPRVVIPSVVGHGTDRYGADALSAKEKLNLSRPIKQGIISNWNDMYTIWEGIYNKELLVEPNEHPILLTETPLNPKNNREITTQIMFETFKTPSMYLANQAVLALFSTGRSTGLVVDIGGDVSHTVPISEGYALTRSVKQFDINGSVLSDFFEAMLKKRCDDATSSSHSNHSTSLPFFNRSSVKPEVTIPLSIQSLKSYLSADIDIARKIKEELCYVALDFDNEKRIASSTSTSSPTPTSSYSQTQKSYELPDGKTITLGKETFYCPELLFQPSKFGFHSAVSIYETCFNSIKSCERSIRGQLCENIVLCGGSSMFPGFAERLESEMKSLIPRTNVRVIASPNRKNAVWIGGSILASLSSFLPMWISRQEYEENGKQIINKKCL